MNPFVFDKSHCTDFPLSPRQREILSDCEKSSPMIPDGSDDQAVLLANAFLRFNDAGLWMLTPNSLWILEQHRMFDIKDLIQRAKLFNSNSWVGWKSTADYARELDRSVSSLKSYLQKLSPDVFDRRSERGEINLRQSAYDELKRNLLNDT